MRMLIDLIVAASESPSMSNVVMTKNLQMYLVSTSWSELHFILKSFNRAKDGAHALIRLTWEEFQKEDEQLPC